MYNGEVLRFLIVLIFVIFLVFMGVIISNESQEATLGYWIPDAKIEGDIVIYDDKVITPENIRIVFPE